MLVVTEPIELLQTPTAGKDNPPQCNTVGQSIDVFKFGQQAEIQLLELSQLTDGLEFFQGKAPA